MLPFKRTFEGEKQQLRELNSRLVQYLSRTKQLEQENVHLIAEINQLRQAKAAEWEPKYRDEMRDLRRMVAQLSFEKSQAELEREKLWRQLQLVQGLCSEQSEVCRDMSGELQGCEQELQRAHQTNDQLQQRLFQLQNERKRLEDAHRQGMDHLRVKVESRAAPIVTQTYRGPPAASMEEVHEYARDLSEGWIHTFEMYQRKVEEMEQGIREDQAMLCDLQREKMLYASELDKMRAEAEKQGQVQRRLEEQLMLMQERFRADCNQYQTVIEQLEEERRAMADTIAERTREHQQLLQVKMDLGVEVSAYRALLEGERMALQDANRRLTHQQRERVIDIRLPAQPYTQKTPSITSRHRVDTAYSPPVSSLRRSPVSLSGSRGPARVVPIAVTGRAQHQSPASRRDMVSFAKARGGTSSAAGATGANKDREGEAASEKTGGEDEVKVKKVHQEEKQASPVQPSPAGAKLVTLAQARSTTTAAGSEGEASGEPQTDVEESERPPSPSQKKVLDPVSVEELIEKVIKPAGLEAKVCSSGDSKLTYHVERSQQEDGMTKTQIVLESKVEEELDFSKDATLEELLNQGVKKVSLEDIEDTETGSMIRDLLSGLQGSPGLENKSVSVEIFEEPVESHADEESDVKQQARGDFHEPPSRYFQIEELENVSDSAQFLGDDDGRRTPTENVQVSSAQVQEVSSKSESSYFSHDQEPREYFVSTPDDNLSEHGEGITSYGHYGLVDDLSDERYYQDQDLFPRKVFVEEREECAFLPEGHSFPSEGFQPRECVIEEEVHVSPVVQESMLEFLKEDSLEPKEQLKGALEKLQSSVSGPLREELAFLTRVSSDGPQNVAVNVRKVQQSSDNGTTTIVAELNVSQTLEDSGLLEGGEELSQEQIMAAVRASELGLEKAFQGGAGGGYTLKISKEE
uniref:Synemin, intermediate filament protein n=1 Tax=Tetraodon nigroviridis TaxID=99883 RepID=H3DPH9_TETNG